MSTKPKTKQKPWEKAGVSKSTYYRKRRKSAPKPAEKPAGKPAMPLSVVQEAIVRARDTQKRWVPVPSVADAMAFAHMSEQDEAVAAAVRRALAKEFVDSHSHSGMIRGMGRAHWTLTAESAAAVAHYVAVGIIHDDARRERAAEEARNKAQAEPEKATAVAKVKVA